MKQIMRSKQNLFLSQKRKLQEAGCEDFNESIKFMFAKAYNVPLYHLYEPQNHEYLDKNDTLFLNMVNRRAAGEPVSHIIKSRSFWKNEFYIEETVLDPRPESELIVEITKDSLFSGMKVLDLGCGSGCIGLSLHYENPEIRLFLSDMSDKALNVAKKNADNLGFTCEIFHSNLFEKIKEKFDLIVTNLPYIEKKNFLILQKEIILYEPHEALYGGMSGIDTIKLFLRDVGKRLKKNGTFVIEFGEGQHALLREELLKFKFSNFDFHRDLNSIPRVVCVKYNT